MLFPAFFLGILLRIPSGGQERNTTEGGGEIEESREKTGETQKRARTAEEENLHSDGDCSYAGLDTILLLSC